jgi:hypothetical protein
MKLRCICHATAEVLGIGYYWCVVLSPLALSGLHRHVQTLAWCLLSAWKLCIIIKCLGEFPLAYLYVLNCLLLVFALAGDADSSNALGVGWGAIPVFTSTDECDLHSKFPQCGWQMCIWYMFIFCSISLLACFNGFEICNICVTLLSKKKKLWIAIRLAYFYITMSFIKK